MFEGMSRQPNTEYCGNWNCRILLVLYNPTVFKFISFKSVNFHRNRHMTMPYALASSLERLSPPALQSISI